MEKQIGKFIVYKMVVRGIFGRNRTEKFGTFELLRTPADTPRQSDDALRPLAMDALRVNRARHGCRWTVEAIPTEVTEFGEKQSFRLDSSRTVIPTEIVA